MTLDRIIPIQARILIFIPVLSRPVPMSSILVPVRIIFPPIVALASVPAPTFAALWLISRTKETTDECESNA
ncbi:hypothetical protein BDV93DRAFT_519788 [Ceratobasidium sp. AG-I]|nr:hypothetical protein BDV93DRAFT_519788 [Ceratobasidium sp. AG-I]